MAPEALAALQAKCPELLGMSIFADVFPAPEGGGPRGMADKFGCPFLGVCERRRHSLGQPGFELHHARGHVDDVAELALPLVEHGVGEVATDPRHENEKTRQRGSAGQVHLG